MWEKSAVGALYAIRPGNGLDLLTSPTTRTGYIAVPINKNHHMLQNFFKVKNSYSSRFTLNNCSYL